MTKGQLTIDLNCDLGESFGIYKLGNDQEIMKYVSSVNIACGFHAGDPSTIRKTVIDALECGVAIGAHPSFPDLQGFGRREMKMSSNEIEDLIIYQVGALKTFVEIEGGRLHHVKPHGALYNMATKDESIAKAIVTAIAKIDSNLFLYGLSNSTLICEGRKAGLKVANEGFVDRTYDYQGNLTPRTASNATIQKDSDMLNQMYKLVKEKKVVATTGEEVAIEVETLCIHGDGEHAVPFGKLINEALTQSNILIRSL